MNGRTADISRNNQAVPAGRPGNGEDPISLPKSSVWPGLIKCILYKGWSKSATLHLEIKGQGGELVRKYRGANPPSAMARQSGSFEAVTWGLLKDLPDYQKMIIPII